MHISITYRIVRAHDTTDVNIPHTSFERSEEVVGQVLLGRIVVVAVAASLEVVRCVVFTRCNHLLVFNLVALKARNIVADVVGDVESVLAGGLLASAPAWVSEWLQRHESSEL